MKTSKSLATLTAAAAVLALTACSGDDDVAATPAPTTPVITTISVAGVAKYMTDIMGFTSETTSSNDISTTELAVDETSEPSSI
jgi:hypothetical protein